MDGPNQNENDNNGAYRSTYDTLIKEGGYGSVYKHCGAAYKVYRVADGDIPLGVPTDAIREISLLKSLSHGNVVSLIGERMHDSLPYATCIMELAELGSLYDALEKRRAVRRSCGDDWPLSVMVGMLVDLWSGLAYLHENGVIHRDIKPDNVLMFRNLEGTATLKIADLGTAVVHEGGRFDEPRSDPVTTTQYRSPEAAFGLCCLHGPAMDVWSAGLVSAEIMTGSRSLFSAACRSWFSTTYKDADHVKALCYKFGTPTLQNDLMPSYYAGHEGTRVPPVSTMHPPVDPIAVVFGGIIPDHQFRDVIAHSLCMEPSRRATAAWMLKRLTSAIDARVPLEHCIDPATRRAALEKRMHRAPMMRAGFAGARAEMGRYLLDLCLRLDGDMSRRTFQTAAAMLDVLSADVDFVTRHMVSPQLAAIEVEADRDRRRREMIKACIGIACVASKVCDVGYLTPEFLVDIGAKCTVDYGRRRYPPVSPPFTAMELVESEMHVIRQFGWRVPLVVPMDFEAACAPVISSASASTGDYASTHDPNSRIGRLRGYIVDTICCCIGGGGFTPEEIDRGAGLMAAALSRGTRDTDMPEDIKTLLCTCGYAMRAMSGSLLYDFYSAEYRHAVSTVYTPI